jgi:hypothetical protein
MFTFLQARGHDGFKMSVLVFVLVTDMVARGQGVPRGAAAIAKVSNAEEISAAVHAGAQHIVVTGHLNLTTLPPRQTAKGPAYACLEIHSLHHGVGPP